MPDVVRAGKRSRRSPSWPTRRSLPVRTLVYPFARYSPEYQAIRLGQGAQGARPSSSTCRPTCFSACRTRIGARTARNRRNRRRRAGRAAAGRRTRRHGNGGNAPGEDSAALASTTASPSRPASRTTRLTGNAGSSTTSQRTTLSPGARSSSAAACASSKRMRPVAGAENLVREAYMRRRIREAIRSGHAPGRIVAVVGRVSRPRAHRRPSRHDRRGARVAAAASSRLTLMPYSYFRALVAIRLRGRQPRPGLLRAAVGRPGKRRPGRAAAAIPVAGRAGICEARARTARRRR